MTPRLVARRRGLRIPRHRATTAHLAALYPFHTTAGLGPPRHLHRRRRLRWRLGVVL